jgi:hypothetical protein
MPEKKTIAFAHKTQLAQFDKLVSTIPGLERKGDTVPYTSLNRHMFSNLNKDGILQLRLPSEERSAFLKKYKTCLSEAYGIIRNEYVDVPEKLLGSTQELKPWFKSAHEYVKCLKPKPGKKS